MDLQAGLLNLLTKFDSLMGHSSICGEQMPRQVCVDGMYDANRDIQYWGMATEQPDGTWQCYAEVQGTFCIVEVKIQFKEETTNV